MIAITYWETQKALNESLKKTGKNYEAVVGDYVIHIKPIRLPVPPGTGLLAIIMHGGRPKGWEWQLTHNAMDFDFKGYALSMEDAKADLIKQMMIINEHR